MSVTRRQFLLSTAGAAVGAIIPSFYHRALEFFEQFGKPLLVAPARVTEDLVVIDFNGYPELCLGDPYAEPPEMTFREYFSRYEPEGFDTFEENWGLEPAALDTPIDDDYVVDRWAMHDSSSARAYHLLQSLDLGPALRGRNAVGRLDFLEESNMVSTWLAVSPRDEVTLSLLQQRLNDLGTGIRVVTDYAT
ncbi:MAG: hypothetical protein MUE63_12865 [Xanthomonadales bacterium]|jgi:hypothetical protein|nr:hypothetical protein [Xanthomonadales bacterium]